MKLMHVALANGDSALFVNDQLIYSLDAAEAGETPLEIAQRLEDACPSSALFCVDMDVPSDPDWNWQDVLELIPVSGGIEPGYIRVHGYHKDGETFAGMLCAIGGAHADPRPDSGKADGTIFYHFPQEYLDSKSIIGEHQNFVVTGYRDHNGVEHTAKLAHVVAWDSESSGGFDWFDDEGVANAAFEKEHDNAVNYADNGWKAYRFTVLVDASLPDSEITRMIDLDLRHYCDTATNTYEAEPGWYVTSSYDGHVYDGPYGSEAEAQDAIDTTPDYAGGVTTCVTAKTVVPAPGM